MEAPSSRRHFLGAVASAALLPVGVKATPFRQSSVLHAKEFGVKGDGSIETTAIQAAINAAVERRLPIYWPEKLRTGGLEIPGPIAMIGTAGMTTFDMIPGTYVSIRLASSDITMQNFIIESRQKSGGIDFQYFLGNTEKRRLSLSNILVRDSHGIIEDVGTGHARHIDTEMNNVRSERLRGDGFKFSRAFAYIFLKKCSADFVGVSTNARGFSFDGSTLPEPDEGGISMEDCNVLGSATQFESAVAKQRGFHFEDITSVATRECKADGLGELGWALTNVRDFDAVMVSSSHCALGQFQLDNVTGARLTGYKAIGRRLSALSYHPANADGLKLLGQCDDIQCVNGLSRDNMGHSLSKDCSHSGNILVSSTILRFAGKRNLHTRGNSPFHFTGGAMNAGALGDFDLGGPNDHITDTQFNDGSIGSAGPGPEIG
ncbi:MAG: hypothetical protein J0I80_13725 [Sphingomonas sp.]|nr:hypothetical protein [Sphingomonas sp.]